MFIEGSTSGVGFWYVCWGREGSAYYLSTYLKLNGLAKWFASEAYREVPVRRVGRVVITGKGVEETRTWGSREEFLKWAKPLVAFPLPDV